MPSATSSADFRVQAEGQTTLPSPPLPFTFAKRDTLFDRRESYWRVEPDQLVVFRPKTGETRIAWAEITGLRLSFAPSQVVPDRYRVIVTTARGKFAIDNTHFVSLGNFEPRSEAYRTMLGALIDRLRVAQPNLRVSIGSRPLAYWGQVIGLTLLFAVLGFTLVFFVPDGGLSWLQLVKIGLILVALPLLYRWARLARPIRTTLDSIPVSAYPHNK